MENEKLEEKNVEITTETMVEPTEDHITFECVFCNKIFDPGRDVIEDIGSRVEKKNFGVGKYIDAIIFDMIPENEKCEKVDDEHILITTQVSNKIIDNIISKIRKSKTLADREKIIGKFKSFTGANNIERWI